METNEQKTIDKLYKEKEINEKIDLGKKLIKKISQELQELEKTNEQELKWQKLKSKKYMK